MFTHKYRYLFIAALALYTYINTVLCEVYKYFKLDIEWYYALGTIMAVTLCTWEGSRLLEPLFEKKLKTHKNKIQLLALFFGTAGFLTTIFTSAIVLLVSMVMHEHSFTEALMPLKLNLIYAWLANLLFHLLNAVLFYFTEYKTKLLEAEELKRMTAQAELQLVKSQINPHFLFNNLNVLSALVMKNNSEANRFIEEFSKVFRYILHNHDKELVDVKTELDYIKPYIFLLQKRFTDGLHIEVDIPEEKERFYIIPASLQMLIENAIKHNIVSKSSPLHINVHANGNNTLVVSNNFQPRLPAESSTRVGLANIMKRYLLVSGKKVEIYNDKHEFAVTIPLLTVN